MITIRKKIDFKSLSLLAVCILPLCLAVPAQHTAASPANPLLSSIIDPPELPLPIPPPQLYQGTTAMERTA